MKIMFEVGGKCHYTTNDKFTDIEELKDLLENGGENFLKESIPAVRLEDQIEIDIQLNTIDPKSLDEYKENTMSFTAVRILT